VTPAARAVLVFFAETYSERHVRESPHPWNFDAWHCPQRDAVKELVALGLARRPFESPWIVNLTDEGFRALDEERRALPRSCFCAEPVVCEICESCAAHCHTEGGPDACWSAHERWRLTGVDDALGTVSAVPIGARPAPKPRWPRS
jgi:hypothetical protein